MRAVTSALVLLAAVLAGQPAAASECLRQTVPEARHWLVSGEQSAVRAAITKLDAKLLGASPAEAAPWLTMQASMLLDLGDIAAARNLLDRAIPGWSESNRVDAEVCARHLLAYALSLQAEPRIALAEIVLAEERAFDAGLDWQLNRLRQTHASLLLTLNERLEEALLLFEQIEPGQTISEQIGWHHLRGLILGRTKRHRQAATQFEHILELAKSESLHATAAMARNNLANQLANLPAPDLRPGESERIISLLEDTVADGRAHSSSRAMALTLLARQRPEPERMELLKRCVEHARNGRDQRREAVCIANMAVLALSDDPEHALALIDEAVSLAEGNPRAIWQIQAQCLEVIWATRSPPQAFADSIAAIAGERQLRERQLVGPERAQFIDGLMWDYRRLADRAYAHAEEYPELVWRAFELLESNRALVLRERRLSAGKDSQSEAVRDLARRINRTQRALVEASGDAERVDQVRAELGQLEIQWRQVVTEEAEMVELPAAANPTRLRTRLGEHQALLSFLTSVPGKQSHPGSGWLHVIHRHGYGLYRVPDANRLRGAAELMEGFDDWQDGAAAQLLQTLGADLLSEMLNGLPSTVAHLVIVPDIGIEALPLDALPGPGGQPLGLTYALELTASASLWFSIEQRKRSGGKVMILADPQLPQSGYRALDAAFPAERLAQLPGARAEAVQIRRLLGPGRVRVYHGAAASEALLKEPQALADTRLIHFATHTLIHPERAHASAILLAADGEDVDGLLQPREIEQLQLDGIAVVLANCSSATGQVLNTEGLMSLSRSFLIAGSPGVISTRRTIDDGDAQAYFERVYRHLAAGLTLSEAMRQARADLHDAGYPTQAWSAYVLYGSGDWRPIDPTPRWPGPALITLGLLGLVLAARGLIHRRQGIAT